MRDELKALQEKHKKELEEYTRKTQIINNLPSDIKPAFLYGFGYKSDAGIKFEIENRQDAARLLEVFPPVPLVKVKGAFLTYFPEEQLTEKDQERNEITPRATIIWSAEKTLDYPTVSQWKWFSHFAGMLIHVNVVIKKDPATFEENHERDHRGRIIRKRWRLINTPANGERKQFTGSQDSPGNVVISWGANIDPLDIINY